MSSCWPLGNRLARTYSPSFSSAAPPKASFAQPRTYGGSHETAKPPIDDPYFVACLRGGEKECVRVATLALIDRNLLAVKSSGASVLTGAAMDENRLEVTDPRAISA